MPPMEELYVLEFYDPDEAEHPLAVRRPVLEYSARNSLIQASWLSSTKCWDMFRYRDGSYLGEVTAFQEVCVFRDAQLAVVTDILL